MTYLGFLCVLRIDIATLEYESIELCDISEKARVLDYVLTANSLAIAVGPVASCVLMYIVNQTNYRSRF